MNIKYEYRRYSLREDFRPPIQVKVDDTYYGGTDWKYYRKQGLALLGMAICFTLLLLDLKWLFSL